jgi:two-component system cell cycle response regulator CtrA
MRVLLIEDDYAVTQSISTILKKEGMVVDTTDDGEDGLDLGKLYEYDIIILDLNLPGMNGYEVLKSLRNSKNETPVLILSGLTEPDKKIKGLGYGADDYLTKPFNSGELVARLKAIIRRRHNHADSIIKTGLVEVNLNTQTVSVAGKDLHLTGKEYGIMELLSLRKGSTLNKDQFLNHLYGGIDEPELKIIDVFICKLRKKLEKASGGKNYIETVWGRGYILKDPDEHK